MISNEIFVNLVCQIVSKLDWVIKCIQTRLYGWICLLLYVLRFILFEVKKLTEEEKARTLIPTLHRITGFDNEWWLVVINRFAIFFAIVALRLLHVCIFTQRDQDHHRIIEAERTTSEKFLAALRETGKAIRDVYFVSEIANFCKSNALTSYCFSFLIFLCYCFLFLLLLFYMIILFDPYCDHFMCVIFTKCWIRESEIGIC